MGDQAKGPWSPAHAAGIGGHSQLGYAPTPAVRRAAATIDEHPCGRTAIAPCGFWAPGGSHTSRA
ncbi:hypothetical protein GCM10022282_00720 [Agromyces indicus]